MKCKNHPEREATFTDSVPAPGTFGPNLNECGYQRVALCDHCAAAHALYVGNTSRLEAIHDAGLQGERAMNHRERVAFCQGLMYVLWATTICCWAAALIIYPN
jgi:hypothetical protein